MMGAMTDTADAYIARQLERLRAVVPTPWAPEAEPPLRALVLASDFATDTLLRQPGLLDALVAGAQPLPPLELTTPTRADWGAMLRRHRAAESTRLVWRDVAGLDDVDATLAGSTALAEQCLQIALDALEVEFAQRFGVVRAADQTVQRLVVFGLGKLGGGELNFSPTSTWSTATRTKAKATVPAHSPRKTTSRGWANSLHACWTKSPATVSAIASTCACAPSATPAAWPCPSRRWSRTSSAKAATGNATPGRRHARWRAMPRPAIGSSKPCGPSSIGVTWITARSTACAK
jgi:hypothetical protein